ncbi:non-structural maintenance of chromosomes element 4 homolog A-like [Nicotiana sylvestris]|uniref:Non-structural maintenance of chromosomes element 4 n=1 Tax=Nicotiana sylvestris TaxID=4096 RepID=A0A1U7YF15_NICSY|nr:PREDICTED: non-structural maintenance of chromosomes element 4 homolog A-like [Nicotiana sylvestris]XP_009801733.1 PREDICTED: non-structural maintenance of chromosomes element 4 homolog A-like [Nicotiana sylvestris]
MEGKCCKTMLGVLKTEFKPKKLVVYRKMPPRMVYLTRPKLVGVETAKDKPDVNKNMSTISELLQDKKCVMLDELLFRRTSFAHTVENLFALSFLVHNGEAAISVDETGSRFLCEIVPRSSARFEVPRSSAPFYLS